MLRKAAPLALVLLLGATPLPAEVNLGINLGIRDQDDEDHTFAVLGLTGDFGPAAWIVRPEVGFFTEINPLDEDTRIEKAFGIVHSWRRPRYRVNLGGGFASVPSQVLSVDDSAHGAYVHGGIEYVREEGSAFGLDLRYVDASDLRDREDPISVDYLQLSFVIHWHIKGPKPR